MRETTASEATIREARMHESWLQSVDGLLRRVCLVPIRLYQTFVSPALPARCGFTPSCSEYAVACFRERNVAAAVALTLWRVMRCNPFSRGGYDPPPCGCQPHQPMTKHELVR